MIRVLVVDDDAKKVAAVVVCLKKAGVLGDTIEECRDANTAKVLLRKNSYDLLVLDVVLPERIDEQPARDAGIKLLNELSQRKRYRIPDHVVGLTAYASAYVAAFEPFLLKSWTVIKYDRTSEEWCQQLGTKVEQILWARESALEARQEYESTLAIVCALEEPELSAVKRLPWGWAKQRQPGDPTIYYRGEYEAKGRRCIVYAAASARMGMTAAAILATKMIAAFRPSYLASIGIAAAIQGRANYGDVVCADLTWDYGSGKFVVVDGAPRFLAAPNQCRVHAEVRSQLVELADDEAALSEIAQRWPGERPNTRLRVLLGPVASGGAVVADEEKARQIADQHRKLLGVEMEVYAIFEAAEENPIPRPSAFSLKGVSDFADSRKDDRYQHYAAYTSAECLRCFAERYLE